MSVKIGSNASSLLVQRNLADANHGLSRTFEKLSSGQRINRAGDDSAGLSISMGLNVTSRVYSQGVRNINDGLSYLAVGDAALQKLGDITRRQIELAEQSANGVYSATQRLAIDTEADALVSEFNRIIKTTEFNGREIIDVEESGLLRIQAGFGVDGGLNLAVGEELSRYAGTGQFGAAGQYTTEGKYSFALDIGDIDGDGDLDLATAGADDLNKGQATIQLNDGDGNFGAVIQYSTEGSLSRALQLADIDGDGDLDLVTAGKQASQGCATIRLNDGHGSFGAATQYSTEGRCSTALSMSDIDGDGDLDMVTTGYDWTTGPRGQATIRFNDGRGNFSAATHYSTEGAWSWDVNMADLDGDGDLDMVTAGQGAGAGKATIRLNDGHGNFGAASQYSTEGTESEALSMADIDGDGDLDMVTAGRDGGTGWATIRLNDGKGTFGAASQYSAEGSWSNAVTTADIDCDGHLDLITAGKQGGTGWASVRLNDGHGNFGAAAQYSTEASESRGLSLSDVDGDGTLDLVTAGEDGGISQGYTTVRKAIGHDVATIAALDLCSQSGARAALERLGDQLDRITSERGAIGAMQSRLSVAADALSESRENADAASSRITDADVAQESAMLTRLKIVQQAATAVLAQANQVPSIALSLLKG